VRSAIALQSLGLAERFLVASRPTWRGPVVHAICCSFVDLGLVGPLMYSNVVW